LDEKADLQLPVDGMTGCLAACLAQKQSHPHLRLLLSIGGSSGSSTFAEVASSAVTRDTFAASARQFIDKYNFDGVDSKYMHPSSLSRIHSSLNPSLTPVVSPVDWEHPKDANQGRDYLSLLQTCRKHLPSPQYLLTSALPTGEWCLRNIDISTVATTLDWINLMCYDFSGPWTELSGHQCQLYSPEHPHNAFAKRSCDAAVKYLFGRGVPGSKVVIGIPVYGRSFLGTNNIGQQFNGHAGEAGGVIEYKDLPRTNAVEYVDWNVGAAFSVGGDAGFVSYDVPATVTAKAQFVKQKGLRGLFYWTGVADAPLDRGDRSLIRAGWAELSS